MLSSMVMIMVVDAVMTVSMCRFFIAVDVGVRMDMGVLMRMGQRTMTVRMGMGMGMCMGVLERNGIFDHQYRRSDHDGKADMELEAGAFTQ